MLTEPVLRRSQIAGSCVIQTVPPVVTSLGYAWAPLYLWIVAYAAAVFIGLWLGGLLRDWMRCRNAVLDVADDTAAAISDSAEMCMVTTMMTIYRKMPPRLVFLAVCGSPGTPLAAYRGWHLLRQSLSVREATVRSHNCHRLRG